MKRMFAGILGALLVLGLAGALSSPAAAGGGYDYGYGPDCNCNGPISQVVNAGTQVVTTHRTINTNRVVPRVRVIDRNRVVLHQRTVVHRQIVTHRHNTEHRNVTINRINTAHKFRTVHKNQLVRRDVNTNTSSHVSRTVRGRDCNCAPGQAGYRGMEYWREQQRYAVRSRY
jgi:hypothetical protein